MRSAATTTLIRGRHRLGRPGLVYVTHFVTVVRRGLFESWRTPGRHRRIPADPERLPTPAAAVGNVGPSPVGASAAASGVPGAYAV